MKESKDVSPNSERSNDPSRKLFSSSFSNSNAHQIPEITLPKGGGALKGIDEKFEVNPVNGTNAMTIPLPVAPARGGFSPSLSLQYNSGSGNGLFGLGWGMSLPAIRRKTDQQLPLYRDNIDSDTYLFAGVEDLLPTLALNASTNQLDIVEKSLQNHIVKQYRPRIEGTWIRIERWTSLVTGAIHWRTIGADNTVSIYGIDANSQIANPQDPKQVFEWLISYAYDNKGNLIHYEYKEEKLENVSKHIYEKNRNLDTVTNRHLKRVHYGNQTPYKEGDSLPVSSDFLFETVLDYGEHDLDNPTPAGKVGEEWLVRTDAFSNFRSGFDIRTYRSCQRVLLFHKFVNEQAIAAQLVSSLDFKYSNEPDLASNHNLEGFSYLREVVRKGYTYNPINQKYTPRKTAPLSFAYQAHRWNTNIQTLDEDALENAPTGINNNGYQWTDLYGEGLSGILVEKPQAWYYKENLGSGHFSSAKLLQKKPSGALSQGFQFQSLEGNTEKQLVRWSGNIKGFFNYKEGEKWETFQAFEALPNRNLQNDPNIRFIDLDGDGRPDLLLTEEDIFQWHASKGKKGFGKANQIRLPLDEEDGPRIVFADEIQSIYLADMTGDGMTDIVRIKNGAVCYWANQGYGRFSRKITMGGTPQFTHPEAFNPKYLKLADIDGSGTTDLLYLYKDSIQIWMNHHGNSFLASPKLIHPFPSVDHQINIDIVDLLGNGTSCIVWSSPHAKDQRSPLRYIDLTDGIKPHLLYQYKNNTGACVQFEYKSSTYYYLEDKKEGTPWVTKLPFPVHVISKTTSTDYIRNHVYTKQYSYHHGYYDTLEREFRGFGRVETLDTESFKALSQTGASNVLEDHYQAPIKTISWYHTGASFKNKTLTAHYQTEYYQNPTVEQTLEGVELPLNLNDKAYHEAFRACKGLLLRQEIYTLDGTNTAPYQCNEASYEVKLVQPHNEQRYASFIVVSAQSMDYIYEQNANDPRIQQGLVLETNEFGIPVETATIIYPRLEIPVDLPWMVEEAQQKIHVTFTKITLTNTVNEDYKYRLPTSCEEQIYEILGASWQVGNPYYTPTSFKQQLLTNVSSIGFEQDYSGSGIEHRLSGHGKSEFWNDDLTIVLNQGQQESLGIPYKSYQLVSTPQLRQTLYTTGGGTNLLVQSGLDQASTSHYHEFNNDGNWWLPSDTTIYVTSPTSNFYLVEGVEDLLGNITRVTYDNYQLLPVQIVDTIGNTVQVAYDYRVLQAKSIIDPNNNHSAVAFDALGIVIKSAILGKVDAVTGPEGDSLDHPTIEMSYTLFNWMLHGKPNYIHSSIREEHYKQNQNSALQETYEYTDGVGNVVMTKVQTKGGEAKHWDGTTVNLVDTRTTTNPNHQRRWIGNGRTILNNKGMPIKQYEPYFSVTSDFEDAPELVEIGFSPILYYDAAGRNIKTDFPNGTFTKVVFDAWQSMDYDVNDTVLQSDWYTDALASGNAALQRSATLAAAHANTPTRTYLDCLGRAIYAENIGPNSGNTIAVHTKTDLSGRYSEIYDQLATEELLIPPYDYNINRNWTSRTRTNLLGQAIYNQTAVKGINYQLTDALGRMLRIWDNPDGANSLVFRTDYDNLHRPTATYVKEGLNTEICFAQKEYGEGQTDDQLFNLRGQVFISRDQSGEMTNVKFDFKGNPLKMTRQLTLLYDQTINWNFTINLDPNAVFSTSTLYDALNRPTVTTLPDQSQIRSTYNEGAYLDRLEVKVNGQANWKVVMNGQDFDAKGQKEWLKYGNNTMTKYFYDAKTFRLENLVTYTNPSQTNTLQDLHYTYDPTGNIMEVVDEAQDTLYYNNSVVLPQKQYVYDHLYRLSQATGREHINTNAPNETDFVHLQGLPHQHIQAAVRDYTQNYTYDASGNITQMQHQAASNNWTKIYDYDSTDPRNLLKGTWIGGNYYDYNFYDGHSNMATMPHLQAMTWNFADQLTAVQLNLTGDMAYYNYDGTGQRVRKVVHKSNKREERLYLGGLERYREYSSNGTIQKETWTLIIDGIAQIDTQTVDISNPNLNQNPLIRYQYSDHLGSATLEMNDQGQVISYEEYHPYGTTAYSTYVNGNYSTKRYRFTNKERDDETGLYYFGVRYYAAWLGRWTSSDPGDFVDGLNLYVYVRNNPVMLVDEEGYEGEPPPEYTLPEEEVHIGSGSEDIDPPYPSGYYSAASYSVKRRFFGLKSDDHGIYQVSSFYSMLKEDRKAGYKSKTPTGDNSDKEYGEGPGFQKRIEILDCKELCSAIYAYADEDVAKYLVKEKMPAGRKSQIEWFDEGGDSHFFIDAYKGGYADENGGKDDGFGDKDAKINETVLLASAGDMVFEGAYGKNEGHAAILIASPKFVKKKGKTYLHIETISAYASLNKEDLKKYDAEGNFKYDKEKNNGAGRNYVGHRTLKYVYTKGENGKYFWKSTSKNRALKGFGRINEKGIKKK